VTEDSPPEPAEDLVDVFYAPFVRPLGNLVVLFAQAEAAWLEFVAALTCCTEKDAQRFLQMKASEVKREIIPLAQTSGIKDFDLQELSDAIESYCCDRERRNRLIHDEWYVDLFGDEASPATRGLPRKKDAVVVWGSSTPDDVWQLALRFREYRSLFSHRTYKLSRLSASDIAAAIELAEAGERIDPIRPTSWVCELYDPENVRVGNGIADTRGIAMALAWICAWRSDGSSPVPPGMPWDVPEGWRFEFTPPGERGPLPPPARL
jgi:hypothetical protein